MRNPISRAHYWSVPHGLCKLADALVCLLSLGLLYCHTELRYSFWHARRRINKQLKRERTP